MSAAPPARPGCRPAPGRSGQLAALPAALLAGSLLLAGCGSSATPVSADDGVPAPPPSRTSIGLTAAPAAQSFPLTGTPAPDAASTGTPVVAVALAAGTGLPAVAGVDAADVVWASFPSAGRQRALALFQSRDSSRVGPVADTRPLDSKLLVSLDAVLEHSGGTAGFVRQVGAAELPEWSSLVHPDTFSRDASGQVYGSTTAARSAPGLVPARGGLLSFGPPVQAAAPPPPVRVTVAGQSPVTLSYDLAGGTWSGTLGGLPLRAANVVVQQVAYDNLVLPKSGGRTEGNPNPDGAGATTVLAGPRVSPGTWNRPGRGTSIKYVGADGVPVQLVPGATWILLVPTGTPVATS